MVDGSSIVGEGSAWRGAPSTWGVPEGGTGCWWPQGCSKKYCVYMSYVPLRKDETGTSQKCRLGSFSGAAAMGWDLCDALGTFGPSPNLVKQGRVLEGAA